MSIQSISMLLVLPLVLIGTLTGQTYELDDPSEPWRTALAGLNDQVMPPYTPLVREANRVRCLGRAYDLDGLFPAGVMTWGRNLLTRPITLQIRRDGQWRNGQAEEVAFLHTAPDRCDYHAEARSSGIKVSAASTIEYDGLIRTDLTIVSQQPVTIDGLRLVISLTPKTAIFHHLEARWGPEIYARSPSEPGAEANYPWMPLIWVGDHDVGLTIVTETSHGWTSPDKSAIRIRRQADELTLTLNIIDEAYVLRD